MKLSTLTILALIGFSSTSFAFVSDSVTCKSQDKKTEFVITSSNRPDFQLSEYDSSSAANSDEYGQVKLVLSENKKEISGRVKMLSVGEGETVRILEQDDAGRNCVLGTITRKIKAQARITTQGRSRDVKLICVDEFRLSSYSIECI